METSLTQPDTSTQHDEVIATIAQKICRMGAAIPALTFLEMHRPFQGLASAGGVILEPAVFALFGREKSRQLRELLDNPELIERLIHAIEEYSANTQAKDSDGRS